MKKKCSIYLLCTVALVVTLMFATDRVVHAKDYFYRSDYYLEEYEGDSSKVVIPDDIKIICELAFYENNTITSVLVSDSVATIRSNAFYKCPNLVYAEIPPSVKKIGKNAFRECGEGLVIACAPNSAAYTYAVENGFDYRLVDFDNRSKVQKIFCHDRTVDYGTASFLLEAKASGKGKLTYKVLNKKVATVSKSGKVTVKNCGRTKVVISAAARGKYLAAVTTVTLTVRPKRQEIKSLTAKEPGTVVVSWKKDKKASGYILECSEDPLFDYNKKGNVIEILISSKNVTSRRISGVEKGESYYVRVRSFKSSGKAKIKGRWSKVKVVKGKKSSKK